MAASNRPLQVLVQGGHSLLEMNGPSHRIHSPASAFPPLAQFREPLYAPLRHVKLGLDLGGSQGDGLNELTAPPPPIPPPSAELRDTLAQLGSFGFEKDIVVGLTAQAQAEIDAASRRRERHAAAEHAAEAQRRTREEAAAVAAAAVAASAAAALAAASANAASHSGGSDEEEEEEEPKSAAYGYDSRTVSPATMAAPSSRGYSATTAAGSMGVDDRENDLPTEGGDENMTSGWTCAECTLVNQPMDSACQACGSAQPSSTARGGAAAAAAPRSSPGSGGALSSSGGAGAAVAAGAGGFGFDGNLADPFHGLGMAPTPTVAVQPSPQYGVSRPQQQQRQMVDDATWTCAHCTADNTGYGISCELCGFTRS